MLHTVLKTFPYSHDGSTTKLLAAGTVEEIRPDMAAQLVAAGLISAETVATRPVYDLPVSDLPPEPAPASDPGPSLSGDGAGAATDARSVRLKHVGGGRWNVLDAATSEAINQAPLSKAEAEAFASGVGQVVE